MERVFTKLMFVCIAGANIPEARADESPGDKAVDGPIRMIVTARRRDEDEHLVPIAMTTVSGSAFADSGHYRLEDLNQIAPSTNIQFNNPRQTSLVIRGLGNNPANDSLESSVGVYLDNVYLGRASMANLDLVDLDQVALLRGPQGTLFGKNTTAGVLAITTRPPAFVREASFETSIGNYDSYQVKGSWSEPLRDDALAARLTFARSVRGGFVSDVTTRRELTGSDRTGGRGQLLWKPSDTFELRTIVDYSEEHSDGSSFPLWNPGPNDGLKYYSAVAEAGAKVVFDPDYDVVTVNGCQKYDARSSGESIEGRWNFGDGYTLSSISAHRAWRYLPCGDADYTDRDAVREGGQRIDDDQWTQELRLSSPADRALSYVLGLYYFNQHQQNLFFTQYGADTAAITGLQIGSAALAEGHVENAQQLDTESGAVFAQATWRPTSSWELALGLRDTREKKQVKMNRSSHGLPAFESNPNFAAYSSGWLERSDDALSGLLSASYRVSPKLFTYASVARDEKSGAISPSPPAPGLDVSSLYVRPERVKDAEAGIKAGLFDQHLWLNANLFWMWVDDYQATQLVQPTSGASFQQILSNIGAVRTRGVEADLAASFAQTTFDLAASYNDATYMSYRTAPCASEDLAPNLVPGQKVCDLTSQPLVGAPRWILNPRLSHRHSVFTKLKGEFQAGYSWHSSYSGTADNSQLTRVPSYGILNVRYSLTGQWGQHPLTISVWSNNVLDRREMTGSVFAAGRLYNYLGTPGPPRTIGITVRMAL